ncbi:MAG: 4Fe-4S dicluster domain-containing protein [Desulfuromonadales bacterium]|nr:4Fe-4S dicluster domain-containing protein [Desulfuromonadales bacterium]
MQYGFFFDQSRCTGCQTCAIACKSVHELPPGPLKYLRIYQYEQGAFPRVRMKVHWVPCYHCEQPSCVNACPVGAMCKEEGHGAVLIDGDTCTGCRLCYEACPYGAPVFPDDTLGCAAQKCDLCIDRLERGEGPACALSCPMRALDFGPLAEMVRTHGANRDLEDLPDSRGTLPAVVFKPAAAKRQILPYDADRALELLMRRDPLPPIFSTPAEVTEILPGTVGRDRLVLKHGSAAELRQATRNDDG